MRGVYQDRTGVKLGSLTGVRDVGRHPLSGVAIWEWSCECGKSRKAPYQDVSRLRNPRCSYKCILSCRKMGRQKGSFNSGYIKIDGAKLKQLRKEKGLTQIVLAKMIGMYAPAICSREIGYIVYTSPKMVAALASALGVKPSELLMEI